MFVSEVVVVCSVVVYFLLMSWKDMYQMRQSLNHQDIVVSRVEGGC